MPMFCAATLPQAPHLTCRLLALLRARPAIIYGHLLLYAHCLLFAHLRAAAALQFRCFHLKAHATLFLGFIHATLRDAF